MRSWFDCIVLSWASYVIPSFYGDFWWLILCTSTGHGSNTGALLAGGAAAAAAVYGAHQLSHGAHHLGHGGYYGHGFGHHGKFKHGKFKHGKFGKRWKHGMYGKHKGGFFKRWKWFIRFPSVFGFSTIFTSWFIWLSTITNMTWTTCSLIWLGFLALVHLTQLLLASLLYKWSFGGAWWESY